MGNNNRIQKWEIRYMKRVRQILPLMNDQICRLMAQEVEDYDVLEYHPEEQLEFGDKWYSFAVRFAMGETVRERSDVSPKNVAWTFYQVDRMTLEREEVLMDIVLPEWKWNDAIGDANMLFTLMNKIITDGQDYLTRSYAALPKKRLSPLDDVEEKLRSFVEAYKGLSKEGQRVFLEDHRHTLTVHPLDFKMWSGNAHEIEEYLRSIGHDSLHVWDSDLEKFSEFVTRMNVDLKASAEALGYNCFKSGEGGADEALADALVDLYGRDPEIVRAELLSSGFMLWHEDDGNIQDMVDHYMLDVQVWNHHSEHVGEFLQRCEISIVEVFDHMDSDNDFLWSTNERIGDFLDRLWYDDRIRLSEVANWIYLKLEQEEK